MFNRSAIRREKAHRTAEAFTGLIQLRLTPPQVGGTLIEMGDQAFCIAGIGGSRQCVEETEVFRPRNADRIPRILVDLQRLCLVRHLRSRHALVYALVYGL